MIHELPTAAQVPDGTHARLSDHADHLQRADEMIAEVRSEAQSNRSRIKELETESRKLQQQLQRLEA